MTATPDRTPTFNWRLSRRCRRRARRPVPSAWMRANLFQSLPDGVLTLIWRLALLWSVPRDPALPDCRCGLDRRRPRSLPCLDARPVVGPAGRSCASVCLLHLRLLSDPQRWRVDLFFVLLAWASYWMLWLRAPRRDLGAIYFFVIVPIASFILLNGWALIGLPHVDTVLWGGFLVTLVVSVVGIVVSLPLGILLALGRRSRHAGGPLVLASLFIEFVRGVPLITVLFMASVMLPLFVPHAWSPDKLLRALIGVTLFASAYMAEVVRGGLQAMPRGQYEGGDGARPQLLADDGLHHPAAGAAHDDPQHRQQLHCAVQGHDAGRHRRHVRLPADHRGRAHRPEMGDAGHQRDRLRVRGIGVFRLLLRMSRYARNVEPRLAARNGGRVCRPQPRRPRRRRSRKAMSRSKSSACTNGTATSMCCATSTSRSCAASASSSAGRPAPASRR